MNPDIKPDLNKLMQEAQKMQNRMQEAQQKLTDLKVTGEAGGGLTTITMNGRHEIAHGAIDIKPAAWKEGVEFVCDLLVAAFNDANNKINEASKAEISKLTEGLNIPSDFLKKAKEEEDKE